MNLHDYEGSGSLELSPVASDQYATCDILAIFFFVT